MSRFLSPAVIYRYHRNSGSLVEMGLAHSDRPGGVVDEMGLSGDDLIAALPLDRRMKVHYARGDWSSFVPVERRHKREYYDCRLPKDAVTALIAKFERIMATES